MANRPERRRAKVFERKSMSSEQAAQKLASKSPSEKFGFMTRRLQQVA